MTTNPCAVCKHPTNKPRVWLCDNCQIQLYNMLDRIPWLLRELDNRIAHFDKISVGTIGRRRGQNNGSPVDFDAAELARQIHKKLLGWVTDIVRHCIGLPVAVTTIPILTLAHWLKNNTAAIAATPSAGHIYNGIEGIVGTDDQPGELITAINPSEQHLVGPCPTPTGYQRRCGHILFADTYAKLTQCPQCGQTIDVEQTRLTTAKERDLYTADALYQLLADIGEPVDQNQLSAWIRARALRPAGYLHNGIITEHRANDTDQPVYSIARARRLRQRDTILTR